MNAKRSAHTGAAQEKPLAWPGDPERITAESIDFQALAHMLANTCRRGGRLRRYHSFAAHGVAMSEAIEDLAATEGGDVREAALLALLHEAAVAWLGLDAAPAQRSTPRLRRLGEKTDRAVREAAGLGAKPASGPADLVRFVARMADAAEERDVPGAGGSASPLLAFPPIERRIRTLAPDRAARLWLERLNALRKTTGTGCGAAAPENNPPGEEDQLRRQEEPHATQAQTPQEEEGTPRAGGSRDAV